MKSLNFRSVILIHKRCHNGVHIASTWVWHDFYFICACLPGHESYDWSVASGPVAPPDITSGVDLTKEPFRQLEGELDRMADESNLVLDSCSQGRYFYIYANSTTPATIKICMAYFEGTCKSLHDIIPCSPKGEPHMVLWLPSSNITQTYGLLMITNDCCHELWYVFTQGQFLPSGIVVAAFVCARPSICVLIMSLSLW